MLIYPNVVFTSTLSLIILKYYYSEYPVHGGDVTGYDLARGDTIPERILD